MEIVFFIRKLSNVLYFEAYLINCSQNLKTRKYIMANHSESHRLPDWLMLVIFIAILAVLFIFGDLFTFIIGILVMSGIFASGYDKNPANHEHH
jgi:hypothetical protein